jgi:type IV secretory pathway component VirB8
MNENDKSIKDVPYLVHEDAMVRMERQIKRLWIALIVAIASLLIAILAFLWYLNLYDFESYEVSATGNGNANYIGQDGDIYNGLCESTEANEEKPEDNQR